MQPEAIIGRDRPARALRDHVERTVISHGGLVLVAGEAGIGKSTLVADAAAHAARAGAMVLTGACWDGPGAPGLWPWVQVVRALRRTAPPETWTACAEAAGPLLPVVLGEPGAIAEHNTFAVFDAGTTLLVTAARQQPVVVVIEDLHWADPASLRLLEFTARHTWFERLLVIGTYRDDEMDAPVAPTTLTLTGLDPAGVAALISRTTGSVPPDELVVEIHRRTGGNPFFVEQTARLWQGGGALTEVPAGVGAVLRHRLARLPDAVVDLLGTAALLGHEFAAPLLAAAACVPAPQVATLLGQAVTARLVVQLDADRYRFAHDIVRETLTVPDAAQRHAAVVRAITTGAAQADDLSATERARHAYLGAAALPTGEAVDHVLLAARDAAARLVPEEAAGHRRRALELLGDDPPRRAAVLLDLAAELVLAGQDVEGRRMVDEAVTIGRALGDPGLLARIALDVQSLGIEGPWVEAIQEAHRRVVGTVAAPAAMAGAAGPLDGAAQQLSVRAARRARDANDDPALAHSLMSRIGAIWGLGTAAERVAITDELAAVAARTADPGLELEALSWRIGALVELGDPGYLAAHRTFTAKAERSGLARFRHEAAGSEAMVATLTGRFDDARAAVDTIVDHGDRPGIGGAETLQVLRWAVALLQGRFDEVDALLEGMQAAGQRGVELMRATSAVQRGDADHARRHLAEVIASGTEHLRWVAPLWLRFQAQAAALTGDPQLCATARAALVPFADQWALTATLVVDGPVGHWIAVLDAALGRWDDAVAGFTAAHGTAERMRARPWSVLARHGLAGALRSRAAPGDVERAEAFDATAERDAAGIGMQIVTAAAERDTFRRDGSVWTLTFAGRTVRLPDAKGLRDLHVLLGVPGTPVPAVRLLDPAGGAVAIAVGSSGGDPVLDAAALAAYRRRLTELDAALDAETQPARADALDRERQALLDELQAATGLGGRPRRLGDSAERARKAVTNRIRDALRRIGELHPELAAHLRATVSTGTTCVYTPPHPRSWRR
ncbi:ATP-binding protein [Pseudonocardia sp. TRM90224]|uniref:ATP-binding protein n=1 Tax=Pseudonocardia sp. TRM90224 TaxID=2812678 RepID=UPI001E5A79E7|nr:AAA family ATPase [Pseudonocardia sp. TRM90224]